MQQMSVMPIEKPVDAPPDFLTATHTLRSWLLTTDHKRIAILYLLAVTVFFGLGGLEAAALRIHLLTADGALFKPETYNRLFTLHGVIMVFFFLAPAIPAVLGNFLLPLMIGAQRLAFPRLNLASWYIFLLGAAFALVTAIGGTDTGVTFSAPFSSAFSNNTAMLVAVGILITGLASILTGFNFIVTIWKMRAPEMTWGRLPLFVWAIFASSLFFVLGMPVLDITLILEGRLFPMANYESVLGGDPLLIQHLFWFYSHPAVYILILPAMGVVSEILPCFTRKRHIGYGFVAASSLAISTLGLAVWACRLVLSDQSLYGSLAFSILTFMVAIPASVTVFNWLATLYRSSISFETPMLYAMGFIGLFVMGGLAGLFVATPALHAQVADTYFVVAQFHFVVAGGAVMGYLGGLHFWWPKITGRMYSERWGQIAAGLTFISINLTFLPQLVLGYMGMPRRYFAYPPEFQALNVMSTAGASLLGVACALPLIYLVASLKTGPRAGSNPWQASGLEWTTASPPPPENFRDVPLAR